jgi:hypothetical protein
LKGQHFVSIEVIQAKSQQVLNTLTPADFNDCFQKWQNRWNRCIQAQGDYFEGDGGNYDLKLVFTLLRANSRKFWVAPRI